MAQQWRGRGGNDVGRRSPSPCDSRGFATRSGTFSQERRRDCRSTNVIMEAHARTPTMLKQGELNFL